MSRLWQNLIYGKCPDCNTRLLNNGKGYVCPNRCGFFITKATLVKILTDPTHAAVKFASPTQKQFIINTLSQMGVVTEEIYDQDSGMCFTHAPRQDMR